MNRLAPLPTVVPLLVGAADRAAGARGGAPAQRAISVVALAAALGMSIALLVDADRNGPLVARIGGWSPTIGISYVDRPLRRTDAGDRDRSRCSPCCVFAIGEQLAQVGVADLPSGVPGAGRRRLAPASRPATCSTSSSSFEILLMASYVLLTLDGDEAQVRAGTTYVVINTIESVVLLVGVGLVYAATGTLSMAELPQPSRGPDPRRARPGCTCCCSSRSA